jgi:hypothetical protein
MQPAKAQSASSFSTSCSEVACAGQAKRGIADRSLSFKSVCSGSKIGPYSQLRGQFPEEDYKGNSPVAAIGGRSLCGAGCRCDGHFDLGQWFRFAQKIL